MMLGRLFKAERDKALYLLVILLVHNLIYPLSVGGGVQPLIFYAVFGAMFVVAVFLLSDRPVERTLISVTGLLVFIAGVFNSYAPSSTALLAVYLSVIPYHLVMIVVLSRYIFRAKQVFTEIILAAVSFYLIIGSSFTPLFGLVEWLQPGSFSASSGAEISWQQLLYFSYVTLTSVGYGDITPTKFYAQSFSVFEAIVGVVFTAVLFSRLVGSYSSQKN